MPENSKHRRAFEIYWRLGHVRSIERLRVELERTGDAPSLRTLFEWSRRYLWQNRIADLERAAKESEDDARLAAITEMNERHRKEGILLQQKGAEWAVALKPGEVTADAATRAITEGARLERLASGAPTSREEIQHGSANLKLAAISDEELDYLLESAQRALGGEGTPDSD